MDRAADDRGRRSSAAFKVALREEWIHAADGLPATADPELVTSTLTLRYLSSPELVFSGDVRYDFVTEGQPYAAAAGALASSVFTVTLGATAHFDR